MEKLNLLIAKLSFVLALLSLASLQTAQAQEVKLVPLKPDSSDTMRVAIEGPGFDTGSPYLTNDVRRKIRVFFKSIEKYWGTDADVNIKLAGVSNPQNWSEGCKSDRRWGVNDNWPYAITDAASLRECGIQNELALEEARAYGTKHFIVDSGLAKSFNIDTEPFGAVDTTNGAPTRKTVIIQATRQRYTELQAAPDINLGQYVKKDEQNERDNEQDSLLTDHEKRITALEDRRLNVSGYVGINGETFADQIAPTISAGVKLGQIEFSGWYGFMPNTGTADLEIGSVNIRRETYGGLATWYLLSNETLAVGPSIGWEHGEDAIEGQAAYLTVYESALVGASLDVTIAGPLHLRANLAYAPVIKSYTYDDQEFADVDQPIRGSIGISVNF